jgi:hypothetical protein
MPYKFHETRRHKFPKARYRVAKWSEYDALLGGQAWYCLRRRGMPEKHLPRSKADD